MTGSAKYPCRAGGAYLACPGQIAHNTAAEGAASRIRPPPTGNASAHEKQGTTDCGRIRSTCARPWSRPARAIALPPHLPSSRPHWIRFLVGGCTGAWPVQLFELLVLHHISSTATQYLAAVFQCVYLSALQVRNSEVICRDFRYCGPGPSLVRALRHQKHRDCCRAFNPCGNRP
jgi:hypothetical protein